MIEKNITLKDIGQWLKDTANKTATGLNETTPEDGGYLISQTISDLILDAIPNKSILWDKVEKYRVPRGFGGRVKFQVNVDPSLNEPTRGTRAYWTAEAATNTISIPQVGDVYVDLEKLTVLVPVTVELEMDDVQLAEKVITASAKAIAYKIDRDILLGIDNGLKGIAGAGDEATVLVSISEAPQEAELKNYLKAMHPAGYANAEWYLAPATYANVVSNTYTATSTLTFESGKYWLFGFPVNVVPQLTATPYHVILGDFTKYVVAYKEIENRTSEHYRFYDDEVTYRSVMKLGGAPLAIASNSTAGTLTLDDGASYGFFVAPTGGAAGMSSSSSSSSSDSSSSTSSDTSYVIQWSSSSSSNSSSSSSSSSDSSNSSSSSSTDGQG